MCNLYAVTKGQQAIRELTRVVPRDTLAQDGLGGASWSHTTSLNRACRSALP
jgi:hypothetical protein